MGATRDGAIITVRVMILCLQRWHLAFKHVLKPPFDIELSILALTTMSFKFIWRLNAAIGGYLKRLDGQIIFENC